MTVIGRKPCQACRKQTLSNPQPKCLDVCIVKSYSSDEDKIQFQKQLDNPQVCRSQHFFSLFKRWGNSHQLFICNSQNEGLMFVEFVNQWKATKVSVSLALSKPCYKLVNNFSSCIAYCYICITPKLTTCTQQKVFPQNLHDNAEQQVVGYGLVVVRGLCRLS